MKLSKMMTFYDISKMTFDDISFLRKPDRDFLFLTSRSQARETYDNPIQLSCTWVALQLG